MNFMKVKDLQPNDDEIQLRNLCCSPQLVFTKLEHYELEMFQEAIYSRLTCSNNYFSSMVSRP